MCSCVFVSVRPYVSCLLVLITQLQTRTLINLVSWVVKMRRTEEQQIPNEID